jgi:hypothetical protein
VASALPREFQKAFTPTERLQFVWIEFAQGVTPPPYFTKVRLILWSKSRGCGVLVTSGSFAE